MDTYVIPISEQQAENLTTDHVDALTEFLGDNAITVETITVTARPDPRITIRCSADPTVLLQGWTPTDSSGRVKVTQAISFLQTYLGIVEAWDAAQGPAPTNAQVAHAAAASAVVLRAMAKQLGLV